MPTSRWIHARLLLIPLAVSLAGCAGGDTVGGAGRARSSSLTSVFNSRPRVPVSVAEKYPADAEQLDFFDELERRDLVSHDDALHASLLLFAGQSGQTFVQRAGRAKQMNLLDPKFDRSPREAITIGELATLLAAGMRRAGVASESAAIDDLRSVAVLPDNVSANAGVSGSQLLTILGHVEDAMAAKTSGGLDPLRPLTHDERALAAPAILQPEKKPTKKPPIDLEKEAQKPRPGQVLPDPAPGPAPASPETPATPAPETPGAAPVAPAPAPAPGKPTVSPRPLPPPRADGGVPSRVDGVASDLRYVAVDRLAVSATEILGPGEFVQWRAVDDGRGKPGEWQTLAADTPLTERLEIRTGLGARVSLKVGDDAENATVVLHRLTRARIEKKIRSDGQAQIGITIYRGVVEAAPNSPGSQGRAPVQIKTPDQAFPLRSRALFEYDAFKGTLAQEFRQ